jgi:hypothetical protein
MATYPVREWAQNTFAPPVFRPALPETEDVEEFPLLLRTSDVTGLIEAARLQGLSAAGLVRRLIADYLSQADDFARRNDRAAVQKTR